MYKRFFKRFLDIVLSFFALLVLSPVLLVLVIVGWIAMKGNPFFVQPRPGKIDPKTGKENKLPTTATAQKTPAIANFFVFVLFIFNFSFLR